MLSPSIVSTPRCLILIPALIVFAGWSLSPQARTVQVDDLYRATVEVPDTGAGSRVEGFARALERVLVKVSGSRDILQTPQAEPLVEQASGYVLRYSYEGKQEDKDGDEGEDAGEHYLHAEFDGSALERAMHSAGLPVWSTSRPTTMVWLGVQSDRGRFIVAEGGESSINKVLNKVADERGVPLILPLMDLEDSRRVEYADIRAGFTENLLDAAKRYNTAVVMIGSLQSLRSGEWTAKWSVHRDNTSSSWSEHGLSLEQALRSGVDGVADILAARYAFSATPGSADNEYLVAIEQLVTLDDYARVLNLLNRFVFVQQAMPVRVEQDRMYFSVRMSGGVGELERALTLSNRLRPVKDDGGPDTRRAPSMPAAESDAEPQADGSVRPRVPDLTYTVKR